MITAGEFRNGRTFEHEGNVFQIVEFQHVKPGKGAAFVRTKLKNIISGGVVEKTFRPTEKFEEAHIDRKDMAYSYGDDDFYHFMDNETFDMLDIAKSEIEEQMKFVKENDVCKVMSYKGNVFGVEPPTNATKPATLETGATIQVPLFVDMNEVIRVDTRTGEYMERVK